MLENIHPTAKILTLEVLMGKWERGEQFYPVTNRLWNEWIQIMQLPILSEYAMDARSTTVQLDLSYVPTKNTDR